MPSQEWRYISCLRMTLPWLSAFQGYGAKHWQVEECLSTNVWLSTPWELLLVRMLLLACMVSLNLCIKVCWFNRFKNIWCEFYGSNLFCEKCLMCLLELLDNFYTIFLLIGLLLQVWKIKKLLPFVSWYTHFRRESRHIKCKSSFRMHPAILLFKILENSRHPLNQSDAKLKTIVSWSFAFSRASRSLLVFNSCSYWLMTRFTLLITVIIFFLVFRHLFENCPLVTKAPSPWGSFSFLAWRLKLLLFN